MIRNVFVTFRYQKPEKVCDIITQKLELKISFFLKNKSKKVSLQFGCFSSRLNSKQFYLELLVLLGANGCC